jgi:hypothetical protein
MTRCRVCEASLEGAFSASQPLRGVRGAAIPVHLPEACERCLTARETAAPARGSSTIASW